MKLITANFLTCAVKGCKTSPASFPLHFRDAELELQECDFQPDFIRNILPRIDWDALQVMASEVGGPSFRARESFIRSTNPATARLSFDSADEARGRRAPG
jgi:hypothetical protein